MPALLQCFEDSLGRMTHPGTVEITGYQLTLHRAVGFSAAGRLPGEQWFSGENLQPRAPVPVVLSLGSGPAAAHGVREFLSTLERSGARMINPRGLTATPPGAAG